MLRNLTYMAGATFSRLISGAVLMVFIARVLGPEDFGHFVLILSLATVMALVVEFGHSSFVMRELGHHEQLADQLLVSTLRAKGVLVLAYAAFATLAWALGLVQPGSELGYVCFCLMAVVVTLGDFLNACFRGVQRFEIETRNVVLGSVMHLLLVAPIVWYTKDWTDIAVAFLVSRGTYLILSVASFKRVFSGVGPALLKGGGLSDAMRQIRLSLMYAADAALVTVRSYADVFLISTFLGVGPLGLYQAGMNLVRAIENVGPIIANVFLPKLSGLLTKPRESALYEKQLLLLLLGCGLACFGVLFLLPDRFLAAIFGERYAPAFGLFPLFGLYLLARFVAMALGVLLTARGYQANRAMAGLVSLGVLALCAWGLMPELGVTAVAVANVLSALVLVAWFALRLRSGPVVPRDVVSTVVVLGTVTLMAYLLIGETK
jgi:O-antigen/teichoic acid export membrane protein